MVYIIYVFLYQNLNEYVKFLEKVGVDIYVFLYQNLNKYKKVDLSTTESNLCISILEFKCNSQFKFSFN